MMRSLCAGEGVTDRRDAARQGAVGRPGAWCFVAWVFEVNYPRRLLPFFALGLGLCRVALCNGRDPISSVWIKPEYVLPEDLAPAEAGALVSERAHPSDVVATIVDLAVRRT